MKDYRLYILMRNDLQSMGPGRAAAQASHASNAFIHKFGKRREIREWQKQTKQGFGTAIVLACNLLTMRTCINYTPTDIKEYVIDPDYVMRVTHEIASFLPPNEVKFLENTADENTIAVSRSETTCAYIFGTKEELEPHLGQLPLYG